MPPLKSVAMAPGATGAANLEDTAFRVGYESPSQFTREYGRMFGMLPRRNVTLLKRFAA